MKYTILTGAIAALCPVWALADASSVLPPDVAQNCEVPQEVFDESWVKLDFHDTKGNPLTGQSIGPFYDEKNGLVYVFPFDGPGFEEGAYGQSKNCSFMQWGTQMFYWLTSTIEDGKQGVPPETPGATDADTKYVFNSEFFYLVEQTGTDDKGMPERIMTAQDNSGNNVAHKLPRTSKGNPDGVGQAGRTHGVLFAQPSGQVSKDGSLVYYSIHANRTYGYLRDAQLKREAGEMSLFERWRYKWDAFPSDHDEVCKALYYGLFNGFIEYDLTIPTIENQNWGTLSLAMIDSYCPKSWVQNIMYDVEVAFMWLLGHSWGSLHEKLEAIEKNVEYFTNPDNLPPIKDVVQYVEPAVDYLSMAMEVKASWVRADSLRNPGDFVQQWGIVPVFTEQDGNLVQTGQERVKLALTGMHLVGAVNGHPEMVWATVEHYSNTANEDYSYVTAGGETADWSDLGQLPKDGWLFSDGTNTDPNAEYAIVHAKGSDGFDANTIVPTGDGAADTPSNVMRLSPWGSQPGADAAKDTSDLISTNQSAWQRMGAFYDKNAPGVQDTRLNYLVTGVSWGLDGMFPDGNTVSQIDGTAAMANTTMETFTQTFGSDVNANGCFGCHGISSDQSKFDVSHILDTIISVEKTAE